MPLPSDPMSAYRQPVDEVVATLGTDARRGLSTEEARARLGRYGRNELMAGKTISAWRKFLAQFQDVLVILLLIATVISAALWLYERETAWPYEAMAIFAVVLLNAVMGYVQQSRAEQAVAALRQMSAAHATVVRDGERQRVPATEIVPGDVILVEEGDTIPADARLIRSAALQTAEAALTGESVPVSKDTLPIDEDVGVGDRHNMVFSGTAATSGRGRAVVVATAMQTEMGRVAGMLKDAPSETTPLQKELARIGRRLGRDRRRHRRRDDRHDPARRGRARILADVRCAHPGGGARGGGGARRLADGGDRGPVRRGAAHGAAERYRAPSRRGRDARLGDRHRLGQDGHAHEERDDGAGGGHRERARQHRGHGLRAAGGRAAEGRRGHRGRAPGRAGARARRGRPRQQRRRARARRALDGAGGPDRGRADRRGAKGWPRGRQPSARASRGSRKCPSRPSAS